MVERTPTKLPKLKSTFDKPVKVFIATCTPEIRPYSGKRESKRSPMRDVGCKPLEGQHNDVAHLAMGSVASATAAARLAAALRQIDGSRIRLVGPSI